MHKHIFLSRTHGVVATAGKHPIVTVPIYSPTFAPTRSKIFLTMFSPKSYTVAKETKERKKNGKVPFGKYLCVATFSENAKIAETTGESRIEGEDNVKSVLASAI